jgi:hypothetical protein
LNDVWNADKAGTQELVHARAITGADASPVAVNHALRPTDYYVLSLADVYITITNFTANSTIQIAGTEEYGAAQTENIAITGNGQYNSSMYWRTITITQVTVFGGNFTYTLTQGQWGVVWKDVTNQFIFDCKLQIGDGSTATYFTDTDKAVVMNNLGLASGSNVIYVRNSATFQLGNLVDATKKVTKNGCKLFFAESTNWQYGIRDESNTAITYLYSTDLSSVVEQQIALAANSRMWNVAMDFYTEIAVNTANLTNLMMTCSYPIRPGGVTIDSITMLTNNAFLACTYAPTTTISNFYGRTTFTNYGFWVGLGTANYYLVNWDINLWKFISWVATKIFYRQYTFDLQVTDKANNPISGATVILKDKNGNTVFNVTTAADDTIAQQTVSRGYYAQATGDTLQEYSPHTLTITKAGYQTYTGNFTLSQKTNWTIALQPLTDGGLIEHVGFVPVDPGLTSPSGTYRWLDVADQAYGIGYRNSYNYSQATVELAYCTEGNKLQGLLKARNLKPNFAYQLKLVGTPGTADNERIGLAGRWWQEEWTGTTWANGQNLNDKGDGSSPNPNDQTYLSRRYIQDSSSPTGYHYRYTGYLVFNYFMTDINGTTTLQFETGSCYHVIWKTTQRSNTTNDGPAKTVTFDPAPSQPAYDTDYPSNTVSIFGEWERLPTGQVNLQPGEYNCQILLTEESFHGSGGTLAGNWAGAVTANIMFTIN